MLSTLKSIYPGLKKPSVPAAGVDEYSQWRTVVMVLIGAGIFFRLFHFLDNRSLYVDEIFLATSLVKMSFSELTAPMLEYEQKAPLGFLWVERLMVMLFGTGEMALRLFPFICGIASLFLFQPVARYFLKPLGVVVAVGVLAAAPPLIYHAVEAKQYSTELFATVVALYLYIRFHKKKALPALVVWGLSGALLLWFSFSSIFILAGMAVGVCLDYLIKREWRHLFRSIIPFSMWLVSFGFVYFLFTHKHGESAWLIHYFKIRHSFMPFPPTSVADLGWFFQKAVSVLHYPLGLTWLDLSYSHHPVVRVFFRMSLLPLAILVVGFAAFYKKNRKQFMVLAFPLLLTLLASGLEVYPFMDRLLVFLAPTLILFLALGCEKAATAFPSSYKMRYILPALLLVGPLANATHQVLDTSAFGDYKKSYHKEVFSYIGDRYQKGDIVYIYWNNLVGYRYYESTQGLMFEAVEGKDYRYVANGKEDYYRRLDADANRLRGNKRVWLVYSNRVWSNIGDFDLQPAWYYAPDNSRESLHAIFSSMGEEVDTYKTAEVNVHLFDLEE